MSETNINPSYQELQSDTGPGSLETARMQAAHEVFFSDRFNRPGPQAVAELIRAGLTEADIVVAGHEKGYEYPVMEATLRDLDRCMPYIEQIDDTLDAKYPDATTNFLFAARDAELLSDYFAITHPDRTSHLMPASTPIWGGMTGSLTMGTQYAKDFLAQYGMTRETLTDGQTQFVVIDTGFQGTVVYGKDAGFGVDGLVDVIQYHYPDIDMRHSDKLAVELVCADKRFADRGIRQTIHLDEAPRFERSVEQSEYGDRSEYTDGNTYGLALNMQTMPRYFGRYYSIRAYEGQIMPIATQEELTRDIDAAASEHHNASVLNPLGAAVVQYRVVQAALSRLEVANQRQ